VDRSEIRLRIIEGLLPPASRLGMNQPETIVLVADALEDYVLNGVHGKEKKEVAPSAEKVQYATESRYRPARKGR